MAHYIRYEIFLPVEYIDKQTNERRPIDPATIREFAAEVVQRYGGYTEVNPTAAPPYRGYYLSQENIAVDLLMTLIVLVPASQDEESLDYFTQWKHRFEEEYNQEVVLIIYSPIQTIGELG